jgi:hypothetical protein
MRTINNIKSQAISTVAESDDNIVAITFNSGKTYSYRDTAGNFVDSVQSAIETDGSVGRLYNRAVKEDQTLQLVAV